MIKKDFLEALDEMLADITEENRKEYISYYDEMIEDKIEDGMTEEDALDEIGDIDEIADKIILEFAVGIGEDTVCTENHSIIDCTNRYRMNDGKYDFTIKIPENTALKDVKVEVTQNYKGETLFYTTLFYLSQKNEFDSQVNFSYNYDGFDYYELITAPLADNGMGIRLYLKYNDNYYMATDTANGSTAVGQSYWLSN